MIKKNSNPIFHERLVMSTPFLWTNNILNFTYLLMEENISFISTENDNNLTYKLTLKI